MMISLKTVGRNARLCSARLVSRRGLRSGSNAAVDDHPESQVLVEGRGRSRTAILNRPHALNALTTSMGVRLRKLYESWEDNPDIGFVMMKGIGRAFCAGGDIVSLYRMINDGKIEDCKELVGTLYRFMYFVGTYLKPHVAILNGITMGSGAGVSIPGTFRVATDNTAFAFPEVQIGFHPDAGASFHLSRLPGHLGEYLALTGEKLDGAEMMACGLATHYVSDSRLASLEEHLRNLITDDPFVIDSSLEDYAGIIYPDKPSIMNKIDMVDRCFSLDTVEDIILAMESETAGLNDPWCVSALKKLKEASPLSLKVALRSIREGRFQTFDQCLIREYRISLQVISRRVSGDFCEGVRARMVDKDFSPEWDPPSLEHVSEDMVDEYFSPLSPPEPDLELPTKLREAFG